MQQGLFDDEQDLAFFDVGARLEPDLFEKPLENA